MPLYGSNGALSTSVPKYIVVSKVKKSNNVSMYVNTTPNAFVKNQVVGIYGITANLVAVSVTKGIRDSGTGWILRKSGMGPVTNVVISTGGSGYSNNDQLKLTSPGCVNTSGNVVTNATGGVVSFTNLSGAGLYVNTASVTVAITNTTGGTANGTTFAGTIKLGGRAGRHHNELLISVGALSGNSSANVSAFPNS
jgi:hypothetical protein